MLAEAAQAAAPRKNPSPEHEGRVAMLIALASLTGHIHPIPLPLPDGKWPDMLMANLSTCGLFMGDGKASEGPSDLASRTRLDGYASWLAPHVVHGRPATLAICCPSLGQARGWLSFLDILLDVEYDLARGGWARRLGPDAAVATVYLPARD